MSERWGEWGIVLKLYLINLMLFAKMVVDDERCTQIIGVTEMVL